MKQRVLKKNPNISHDERRGEPLNMFNRKHRAAGIFIFFYFSRREIKSPLLWKWNSSAALQRRTSLWLKMRLLGTTKITQQFKGAIHKIQVIGCEGKKKKFAQNFLSAMTPRVVMSPDLCVCKNVNLLFLSEL